MLILYSTLGCHLCEVARHTLLQAGVVDHEIDEIDIAASEDLVERYGTRIPVVKDPLSNEEIFWPFSAEEFVRWWNGLE